MIKLQKFCFVCSLRTGTIIIASILALGSMVSLLTVIGTFDNTTTDPSIYRALIALHLLLLCVNGSLLAGAYKEMRYFLLPWIILKGSFLVLIGVLGIVLGVADFMFFLLILLLGPSIYIWLIVMSYYQTIDPKSPHYVNAVQDAYAIPPDYTATSKYPEVV